jgi:acetyltransferase-like isoleucine patch superfamily enzyme
MHLSLQRFLLKRKLRPLKIKLGIDPCELSDTAELYLESDCSLASVACHFQALRIGAFSYIRSGCELACISRIGRFCSIGNDVVLGQERYGHPLNWVSTHPFAHDEDGHSFTPTHQPTQLGNDVWIGREAMIMEGVSIGHGAMVGARALVTHDVPPYAVVAGAPARIIRYRHPPEIISGLLASQWWDFPRAYLREAPMDRAEAFLQHFARRPPDFRTSYAGCLIRKRHFSLLKPNEIEGIC